MNNLTRFLGVSFLLLSSAPAIADCKVPRGEIAQTAADESKISNPDGSMRPMTDQEKRKFRIRTFVQPSSDCKTVRVWQTQGDYASAPTNAQCRHLTGDFSPYPGLLTCTDFKLFPNAERAESAPRPRAFIAADGSLVTSKNAVFAGIVSDHIWSQSGSLRMRVTLELPASAFTGSASTADSGKADSAEAPK